MANRPVYQAPALKANVSDCKLFYVNIDFVSQKSVNSEHLSYTSRILFIYTFHLDLNLLDLMIPEHKRNDK